MTVDPSVFRVDPLYYPPSNIMLKIQNYVPPMREELDQQYLAVDTWNRGTLLPQFFYQYFIDTFMIKAYTCDELTNEEQKYPGLSVTYSCYCNNGDYHTMPDINFEVRGERF